MISTQRDVCLDMDRHLLLLLLLLWSSGVQADEDHPDSAVIARLVGGASRCAGALEILYEGQWKPAWVFPSNPKTSDIICEHLDCGSDVSTRHRGINSSTLFIGGACVQGLNRLNSFCAVPYVRSTTTLDITCSGAPHRSTEFVRLVGGASRCEGTLELNYLSEWRPVRDYRWDREAAAAVCKHLDCGSAVSVGSRKRSVTSITSLPSVWRISGDCFSGSALRHCIRKWISTSVLHVTCSDSVRLLNGSSLCSGRLQVKSNQSWSSVCEADFDRQDAEVVCRELGCGPPSVLQGALYGEVEAPVWNKEFQCGGHESALLNCRSSGSARSSCSPGKAVGLTCLDPLAQPIIILTSMDGVSEAQQQGFQVSRGSSFTVSCSIQPQYPGGSFHLTFTSSDTKNNYTQPAVNHSANFPFPAAEPAQQGNYSCVYQVHVSSHKLSSESHLLSVTVSGVKQTWTSSPDAPVGREL
ncbi:scavenger receptor cysteine-rich type 1 protein M130-like isoform X2 [Oreochromis aureus]|uniref:SRCR domain-containing protein n=1 Tax=Oreochromis aureus TaxID=47969 RepID=A0AAZ1XJM3_OREAU|nr:scavenger receptor cysteine-rich type 1 protein M130-like isoform X2 [Oreochromis aureus]